MPQVIWAGESKTGVKLMGNTSVCVCVCGVPAATNCLLAWRNMYCQYVFCAYLAGQSHVFLVPAFVPRVLINGAITSMYRNCNAYGYIFLIPDTYQAHPCCGVVWCRFAPLISAPLTLILKYEYLPNIFLLYVGFSKAMAQTIWWMHRPSWVCWNIFALPASTTYTNLTEWCCSRLFTVASCFCLLVLFLSPRFFLLLLLPSAPLLYFQRLIVFLSQAANKELTQYLHQFALWSCRCVVSLFVHLVVSYSLLLLLLIWPSLD